MPNRLLRWFRHGHYQESDDYRSLVAEKFQDFAHDLDILLPESAEKTAGFRKLVESKDCLVRAAIEAGEVPKL